MIVAVCVVAVVPLYNVICIPLALYASPFLSSVIVTSFLVHVAVNVTVAPAVGVKFLKYVFFVAVPLQAVVGLFVVPVLAVEVFNPAVVLDVHPANVYPLLVGLLICTAVSYVPLVGAFATFPPSLFSYSKRNFTW